MSLLRQSSLAAVAAVVLTGSRFALAAIVARRLSPTGLGQFVYAQWLVDMAFLVCSLGSTAAVGRYVAEYRSDPAKLTAFIQNWRPWGVTLPLFSGVLVLIGSWLSGFAPDLTSGLLLALWTMTSAAWSMQTAALTGFQRFDLIFYANLVAAGIMLAGALLLPIASDSPAPLFALMAAASGVAALPGLSQTMSHNATVQGASPISTQQWRSIRHYAANMWLIALLWSLLWSRGELPIVKVFIGDVGVAGYAVVLTLFGGAIQGAMLGVSAVAPQLTRLWGAGRKDEALGMARTVMDIQLMVCGAGAIVLICLGAELLSLVFGPSYGVQSGALTIISVGLVSIALANQNHLLQITTDGRYSRNTSLIGLIILMGLAMALVPAFGIRGAAIARAATMLILACFSTFTAARLWGSNAVSTINFAIVFSLVTLVGLLSSLPFNANLTQRGALLTLGFLVLSVAIRDKRGRTHIGSLVRKARPLW